MRRALPGALAATAVVGILALLFAPGAIIWMIAAAAITAAGVAASLAIGALRDKPQPAPPVAEPEPTDPLTNALNRSAFMRRLDDVLISNTDQQSANGALLLVKAGQMRNINDDFGVDTGDDVLCALASTIRASVRNTDFVGRIGSGQFGVFLLRAAPNDAVKVADRIRRNVAQLKLSDQLNLSVSVGGAIFASQMDADDVLRIASESLDASRNDSGGMVEMIYLPKDGERVLIAGAVH